MIIIDFDYFFFSISQVSYFFFFKTPKNCKCNKVRRDAIQAFRRRWCAALERIAGLL